MNEPISNAKIERMEEKSENPELCYWNFTIKIDHEFNLSGNMRGRLHRFLQSKYEKRYTFFFILLLVGTLCVLDLAKVNTYAEHNEFKRPISGMAYELTRCH